MSDLPNYTFTVQESFMPYEFSPDEYIAHLLHCIEKMHDLLHSSDSKMEMMYVEQIGHLFTLLNAALKPEAPNAKSKN